MRDAGKTTPWGIAVREIEGTIVAVNESCALGAGLELAMACDVRVAAAGAEPGMPEVKGGLLSTAFLPRLVGWGRARHPLHAGKVIDAGEAERIDLVDRVSTADEIRQTGQAVADEMAAHGPTAIPAQERLLCRRNESYLEEDISAGIEKFDRTFESGDPSSGMTAFLEWRQPCFED
jgi:enoyl-CoA hydratase/carnithine racemase